MKGAVGKKERMNDGDVFVWWMVGSALFLGLLCIASTNAKKRRLFKQAYSSEPVSWRLETPGSAKFVTEKEELKPLLGRSGIRCGYTLNGDNPLRFAQDSHMCVIAPTGSGKGTDFVIPNVLSLDDHSLFVIDTKCEIAPVTIAHRAKLGPVWVLNPYEMNMDYLRGHRMAQYNPMARLFDPKEPRLNKGPVSEKIADGLILADTPGVDETFWTGGGKGLLCGTMLGQAKYGLPDARNLPAVRRILSGV
jgi:type IV secretory pathway TraG/TraD family ATPase VirD4